MWLGFDVDIESKIDRLMTHFQDFWSTWDWYVCKSTNQISIRRPWSFTKQFFGFSLNQKSTSFGRRFRVKTVVMLHRHSQILIRQTRNTLNRLIFYFKLSESWWDLDQISTSIYHFDQRLTRLCRLISMNKFWGTRIWLYFDVDFE